MKAMRGRIALPKHCVRNEARVLFRKSFRSAHASSRRFAWCGKDVRQRAQLNRRCVICVVGIGCLWLTSCANISSHEFSQPTSDWQNKTGQLMYRSPKTTLIGDALVRFSKTGDFELTVSKGPGITLLSLRQDGTFAEVKGAFARQGWSGRVDHAPPQLRGWLGLRDQFIQAPDRKMLRYVSGTETFLFRF
jgi:hypothetical protein